MNIRNVNTDTKLLLFHVFIVTSLLCLQQTSNGLQCWMNGRVPYNTNIYYLITNQLVKGHDSNNNSSKIKTGFLNPFMHFTNEIQQNTSIRLDI